MTIRIPRGLLRLAGRCPYNVGKKLASSVKEDRGVARFFFYAQPSCRPLDSVQESRKILPYSTPRLASTSKV